MFASIGTTILADVDYIPLVYLFQKKGMFTISLLSDTQQEMIIHYYIVVTIHSSYLSILCTHYSKFSCRTAFQMFLHILSCRSGFTFVKSPAFIQPLKFVFSQNFIIFSASVGHTLFLQVCNNRNIIFQMFDYICFILYIHNSFFHSVSQTFIQDTQIFPHVFHFIFSNILQIFCVLG